MGVNLGKKSHQREKLNNYARQWAIDHPPSKPKMEFRLPSLAIPSAGEGDCHVRTAGGDLYCRSAQIGLCPVLDVENEQVGEVISSIPCPRMVETLSEKAKSMSQFTTRYNLPKEDTWFKHR